CTKLDLPGLFLKLLLHKHIIEFLRLNSFIILQNLGIKKPALAAGSYKNGRKKPAKKTGF
ncbi:hypothetical protein LIX07_001758, partial [Acinetobacter baumannii]|uniref:hypothetical protein n=1 Tax=Acinetobacter baumannii TaxID=470 RepID=UPI0037BF9F26